jgi:hypothetical protein
MSNNLTEPVDNIEIERRTRENYPDAAIASPDQESDGTKTRTYLKLLKPITSVASKETNRDDWRRNKDSKVVGLKNYGLDKSVYEKRHQYDAENRMSVASFASLDTVRGGDGKSQRVRFSVEEKEEEVRRSATKNCFVLFYLGNLAALKVMFYYLSKFGFHYSLSIARQLSKSEHSASDVILCLCAYNPSQLRWKL